MIYVIGHEENWKTHPIKIGFTKSNPYKRLANLQVGNPDKLAIVHTMQGTEKEETKLHKLLEDFRIGGEWFAAFYIPESDLDTIISSDAASQLIAKLIELGYKFPVTKSTITRSTWTRYDIKEERIAQIIRTEKEQRIKAIKENLQKFKKENPNIDILRSTLWSYHTEIGGDMVFICNLINGLHCKGLWDKDDLIKSLSKGMYEWDVPQDIKKSHRDYYRAIKKLLADGYMEFDTGLSSIKFDEKAYLNEWAENYGDNEINIVYLHHPDAIVDTK